jgi:hypothetical protein
MPKGQAIKQRGGVPLLLTAIIQVLAVKKPVLCLCSRAQPSARPFRPLKGEIYPSGFLNRLALINYDGGVFHADP